jgi:hypothetical protein
VALKNWLHLLTLGFTSELTAAREDPNLERAILRLLTRSLSVLVASLTAQLPPLLASPHYVPASCTLPPAQWDASTQHGLALAAFCNDLLAVFSAHALGAGRSSDLGTIFAAIEHSVFRLTAPLFAAVQAELIACLDGATHPAVYKRGQHPALQQLQVLAPHAGRALRRYGGGGGNGSATESQLAGVLIAVAWAGMRALVCRPTAIRLPSPSGSAAPPGSPSKALVGLPLALTSSRTGRTPPGTPKNPLRLLKDKDKDRDGGASSPNAFSLVALPAASRPPSPPTEAAPPPLVLDFKVFLDTLERELPRPPANEGLAGEAVEEAFGRVRALGRWIAHGFGNGHSNTPTNHSNSNSNNSGGEAASALEAFLNNDNMISTNTRNDEQGENEDEDEDIPFLLALELVLRHRLAVENGAAAFLGMDDEAYRKRCLSGFGHADEWACVVGRAVCTGLIAQVEDGPCADASARARVISVGGGGKEMRRVVREWIEVRVEG